MAETFRPSARVLCVNSDDQVLLMHWRDPHDGTTVWEPPGGGIEAGESAKAAAARELREETGLVVDLDQAAHTPVACDVWWNGRHQVGTETHFLMRFDATPTVSLAQLLDYEVEQFIEFRWLDRGEIAALPDRVLPDHIMEVLARLEPAGPWL